MPIPVVRSFVRVPFTQHPPQRILPNPCRPRFLCSLYRPPIPAVFHTKTKFLVLSDLHVRRETLHVCLAALQLAHDAALARSAAVLFLGDFWHARGSLPVEPLNAILTHLSTWRVPLIMIPGNHDLISRSGNGVSLVPLATTLDHRCLLIDKPTRLFDALFLPYMHDVVAFKRVLHDAAAADLPLHAVFCHVTVAGAYLTNNILSPSSPRSVKPSDFPQHTHVYSGHLHRPHRVAHNINYVGSPYQVSAAECGQQKSLLVLDRTKQWGVVESIPIDIGPRHFTVALDSPCVLPDMRRGDRIVLKTSRHPHQYARHLRDKGIRVELQSALSTPFYHSLSTPTSPLTPAQPRIATTGSLSNIHLFEKYAALKCLPPHLIKVASDILQHVGGNVSTVSGKDVVINWKSVTLRSFGPFEQPITYPLSKRGLVLITGRDCDEDGVITGRTNATGKTSLVMAALWAITGRTDPRPDGSVERGVSLEMVHDDATDCCVSVDVTLSGDRPLLEACAMMNHEERLQANLVDSSAQLNSNPLNVLVIRTSTRNGPPEKTRSYKQALCLQINGVDVSCLDTKETQSRIDRLINGTLLQHTVFFGQHMGAGRGLLDSTDRTLKEHLALIFPLDIWREARKQGKQRLMKSQDLHVAAEATLEAAKAVVARLQSAHQSAQQQLDSFEETRKQKLVEIEQSFASTLATVSRSDEDSIAFSESLAAISSSSQLSAVVQQLKQRILSLDDSAKNAPDDTMAMAAAALARSNAAVTVENEFRDRILSLLQKGVEWEVGRLERKNQVDSLLNETQAEAAQTESFSDIDVLWKKSTQDLRDCDDNLQQLVGISLSTSKEAFKDTAFNDQFFIVEAVGERLATMRDRKIQLQSSLQEIRNRLMQSEEFVLFGNESLQNRAQDTEVPGASSAVTCEKCLRPFDGALFEKARSKLQLQANNVEKQLLNVTTEETQVTEEHDGARNALNMLIDGERARIMEKKREIGSKLSALRGKRERRMKILNEIEQLKLRSMRLAGEHNLYTEEIKALDLCEHVTADDMTKTFEKVSKALDDRVEEQKRANAEAMIAYDKAVAEVKDRHQKMLLIGEQKRELRGEIEHLQKIQADIKVLESERESLRMEPNPFEESLRVLDDELSQESKAVEKQEVEFALLTEQISTLKAVDVAFGPRGIPSFVLEEGLTWLEKKSGEYLQNLSGGELMLQIRAFSDYKSSNRVDGENKEVISKRIFVRKNSGDGELRERALRQLSGGQRRRCSLAFALAFADLAHERAGFQSSMIVFDEILQSLDQDGRARASQILPTLLAGTEGNERDTVIVVAQDEAPELGGRAHGGIDVVERHGDSSTVILDGSVSRQTENDDANE